MPTDSSSPMPAAQGEDVDAGGDPGVDVQALEAAIFALLAKRSCSATICPSDAARAVYPAAAQWRAAMPAVRTVAAQLVARGALVVTEGGKVVDMHTAKGPIRLRLPPGDVS